MPKYHIVGNHISRLICIPEFHKQCSAMAPVLSKEKISERDNEARDPTAAVKDWVKTVDLLKAGSYL